MPVDFRMRFRWTERPAFEQIHLPLALHNSLVPGCLADGFEFSSWPKEGKRSFPGGRHMRPPAKKMRGTRLASCRGRHTPASQEAAETFAEYAPHRPQPGGFSGSEPDPSRVPDLCNCSTALAALNTLKIGEAGHVWFVSSAEDGTESG